MYGAFVIWAALAADIYQPSNWYEMQIYISDGEMEPVLQYTESV